MNWLTCSVVLVVAACGSSDAKDPVSPLPDTAPDTVDSTSIDTPAPRDAVPDWTDTALSASCEDDPAGTPCDDGDPCTRDDQCTEKGLCEGATPVVCDEIDGNPCTQPLCDPNAGDPALGYCYETPISSDAALGGVAQKEVGQYSEREVFVVSDADWRTALSLVPVSTWTRPDGTLKRYPTFVVHTEGDTYDADAVVVFLQQYGPTRVTLVGDAPAGLAELLASHTELNSTTAGCSDESCSAYFQCMKNASWTSSPTWSSNKNPDGARPKGACGVSTLGGGVGSVQTIAAADLPLYWQRAPQVVLVDAEDYPNGLMASVYASAINAPLFLVDATNVEDWSASLTDKHVTVVGDVDPEVMDALAVHAASHETLDGPALQARYITGTGTDQVVLANWRDREPEFYRPDAPLWPELGHDPNAPSPPLMHVYRGLSLAAPFLAAAQHALLVLPDIQKTKHLLASQNPNSAAHCQHVGAVRTACCPDGNWQTCPKSVDSACTFASAGALTDFCTTLESQWAIWNELTGTIQGIRDAIQQATTAVPMTTNALSIVASTYAIPHSNYSYDPDSRFMFHYTGYYGEQWGATWLGRGVDASEYADWNGDHKPDVAVGRLMGFTVSDASALVARSLFYDSLKPPASAAIATNNRPDWSGLTAKALGLQSLVTNAGFSWESIKPMPASYTKFGAGYYQDEHFSSAHWMNRALLFHVSHGRRYWIGPWAYEIPKLTSTLLLSVGHNSLDTLFESADATESTGLHAIRKGAIGVMGTVWVGRPANPTYFDAMTYLLTSDHSVGEAFRLSYQWVPTVPMAGLDITHDATYVGDPTLHIRQPNPLSFIADQDGNGHHDLLDLTANPGSTTTLPCTDESLCTANDRCMEGVCLSDDPVSCDDGNPCTNDSCHPTDGCINTITTPCESG